MRYHTPPVKRVIYAFYQALCNDVPQNPCHCSRLIKYTVHDPDFRQSEKDWFSFVEKLTERLVEIDDTVPELPVKDIVSCPLHACDDGSRRRKDHVRQSALTRTAQDLPHLSGCPLLQRSHPVQGAHCPALLASRPAACPSPPRLAPSHRPMPAWLLQAGCT